jgi:hypothetical protein
MKKIDPTDKVIQSLIYERPDVIVRILNDNGYSVSKNPTLQEITEKTFKAIYEDTNKQFIEKLDILITTGEYNNAIGLILGVGSSIISGILGSSQAKRQRELQQKIAIANLENEKLLGEEKLRVYGETERTKILANSLLSYRTSLQSESTQRQKNVYIYLISIGLGISIIYGTNLLLSE